jgi:hypothetical protein
MDGKLFISLVAGALSSVGGALWLTQQQWLIGGCFLMAGAVSLAQAYKFWRGRNA